MEHPDLRRGLPSGRGLITFRPRLFSRPRCQRRHRSLHPQGPRRMLTWALKKILGTSHEREIKKLKPLVDEINKLEPKIQKLKDAELKAKTGELKEKLDNGATLDDILVEAFAVAREAGIRSL